MVTLDTEFRSEAFLQVMRSLATPLPVRSPGLEGLSVARAVGLAECTADYLALLAFHEQEVSAHEVALTDALLLWKMRGWRLHRDHPFVAAIIFLAEATVERVGGIMTARTAKLN